MATRRRAALVALVTSALAGGILPGAVALAAPAEAPATASPTPAAPGTTQTRPSEVHTVALPDRPAALKTGPSGIAAPSAADSGQQDTAGFSLVGVSWDRASSPA